MTECKMNHIPLPFLRHYPGDHHKAISALKWSFLAAAFVLFLTITTEGALAQDGDHTQNASRKNSETLRPNDLLDIRVFQHPELSMEVRVDLDYTIQFPVAGTISVRNLLPSEVADRLKEELIEAKYERVQVVVQVAEYAPRHVYVFGEVKGSGGSGGIPLPPGTQMTVLQAISRAGGYTKKADLRNVYIQRKSKKNETKTIELDVAAVMNQKGDTTDMFLQVGDVVTIPSAEPVAVLGKVKEPKTFYLPQTVPFTVTEAVARAGGLADLAKEDSVLLVRGDNVTNVDFSKMFRRDGDLSLDMVLQPGDKIYVSESRW